MNKKHKQTRKDSSRSPNQVIYIFVVTDLDKARAFISALEAVEARKNSGVLSGEYWFVSEPDGQ
jgi:hypothetical protein